VKAFIAKFIIPSAIAAAICPTVAYTLEIKTPTVSMPHIVVPHVTTPSVSTHIITPLVKLHVNTPDGDAGSNISSGSKAVGDVKAKTVTGTKSTAVGGAQLTTVGDPKSTTVGGAQLTTVGDSKSTTVGGAQLTTVGDSKFSTVGGAQLTTVGDSKSTTVGGAQGNPDRPVIIGRAYNGGSHPVSGSEVKSQSNILLQAEARNANSATGGAAGSSLAYLSAFGRPITSVEDPSLSSPAIGLPQSSPRLGGGKPLESTIVTVATAPSGNSSIQFGNGTTGQTLPMGTNNINGTYRFEGGTVGRAPFNFNKIDPTGKASVVSLINTGSGSGTSGGDAGLQTEVQLSQQTYTQASQMQSNILKSDASAMNSNIGNLK